MDLRDAQLLVNGVSSGSIASGSTVDVQLSDSGGVVVPDSVTLVGNALQITLPDPVSPLDSDAQAIVDSILLTDLTIIGAIDTAIKDMKTYGIWNKVVELNVPIFGSPSANKWNWKDPRDLDAAFRLTFFGGITHDINGIKGNGINAYANTHCNLRNSLTQTRMAMGTYIHNIGTGTGSENDGARDTSISSWLYIDHNGTYARNPTQVDFVSAAPNYTRFIQTVRSADNLMELYHDGLVVASTIVPTTLSNPNCDCYILAMSTDNTPTNYSAVKTSLFYLASNFTQTDAINMDTVVTNFMTTIGINV